MDKAETLAKFRGLIKKIKSYEEVIGLAYWDMRTGAPKRGIEGRSEAVGVLSAESFKLAVSDEMGELLARLREPETYGSLSRIDKRLVDETAKEYERNRRIPPELYQEYVVLTSQAEAFWEEAKANSDYAGFRPYLERIIDYTNRFIDLWGVKGTRYDTLLDQYEPGMTTAELDRLFGGLREKLVPLAAAIAESPAKPDRSVLAGTFEPEAQRRFSLFILKEMGFDFDAGRLDESVHPFATGLGPGDVRITTRYLKDDVASALFGTIHEGGHALYEQNISAELTGTPLAEGASYGIHESQSRFWEIFISMSRPFWNRYLRELQRVFPGQLDDVSVDQFYRAINRAEPSLIRIEADELTYNLHIMIRYEIEKQLIAGQIEVKDLPQIWNDKYEEYLGVRPSHDGEGVLQDVHWSGGSFGYFPSYSLGNMYAAQICAKMKQELPDFTGLVERGEFAPIKEWLTERIYRHGMMMKPEQFMQQVTGEELDARYLIEHLQTKFGELYS